MVMTPPSPTPLGSIPGSAAPGRTNEVSTYTPPHTATIAGMQHGSGPYQGPIPNAMQTMTHANPIVHHLASGPYTNVSYQDDLNRFKEDLATIIRNKLGVDMGSSRLYQKSYPLEFDFVSYPAGWHVPEYTKFNVDDTHTT